MSSIFFGCNLRDWMVFQNQRRPNKKEWKDDRVQWDFQSLPPVRLKGILERLHTEYWLHFTNRRWERKCKTMISLPDILSYCWILLTVVFCFGGCISWHVVADNWYLFACICLLPGSDLCTIEELPRSHHLRLTVLSSVCRNLRWKKHEKAIGFVWTAWMHISSVMTLNSYEFHDLHLWTSDLHTWKILSFPHHHSHHLERSRRILLVPKGTWPSAWFKLQFPNTL